MHKMKLSGLDLDLLVALDALLDTGSVSATAERIHRSQPAVSRMLSRLRICFDDPLFVPHGRGLAPTPRALSLRGPLKLSLSEFQHLLAAPRPFDPMTDRAHFRIVSSDYAAVALLGSIVSWMQDHAPQVQISLLPPIDNPIDLLARGDAELMFGPPAISPVWCSSQPVIEDSWMCVRRQGEKLPRTVKEYLNMAHVSAQIDRAFSGAVGGAVEQALQQIGAGPRRVQTEVADFAAALFLTANSSLLATVPSPVARAAVQVMPLVSSKVPFSIPASSISMIWPKRLDRDPSHVWLRQSVQQHTELSTASKPKAQKKGSSV